MTEMGQKGLFTNPSNITQRQKRRLTRWFPPESLSSSGKPSTGKSLSPWIFCGRSKRAGDRKDKIIFFNQKI